MRKGAIDVSNGGDRKFGPDLASGQPLSDSPSQVRVTKHDLLHRGRVWDVIRDDIAYNDEHLVREYLDHPGSVAVMALDDQDRVLLINQYRHSTLRRMWEIPAGLLDVDGEPALDAAKRELAEEADVSAAEWSLLSEFFTTPGSGNEALRIYLARGITSTETAFKRSGEEADISKQWVPLKDVLRAVIERRVQNPSLVVGTLAAEVARTRDWATLSPADTPWPWHDRSGSH